MNQEELDTENSRYKRERWEFLKGLAFGVLLSAIVVMSFLLFRYGTLGSRTEKDADVLTSGKTALKLETIKNIISRDFLYDVDGEDLETYMFKGIAAGLDDKYAAYYSAKELEDVNRSNSGEYFGIGVVFVQSEDGEMVINRVYSGSPAQEAGLKTGDILVRVEDKDVKGMDLTEAADLVLSYEDKVNLTVLREEKELEVEIEYGQIQINPVSQRMLTEHTGFIRLQEFDEVTVEQFENALKELSEAGAESLIIDLRDNPGGLLNVVCDILDDLLPEGTIVSTQTRDGKTEDYTSDSEQMFKGKIAVLVNSGSASAAELFSGAIQDYELGPIIGTVTYGKGVVQQTYSLSDGSAIKLTAQRYLTAGGRDIDGKGIIPDIEVEKAEDGGLDAEDASEDDPCIAKALEELADRS